MGSTHAQRGSWQRGLVIAAAVVAGALAAPLALPAAAAGTTLYVAQGGNNPSNDCGTAATPCATVSYALTQASAGATINVAGTIADRFTIDKAVTITGVDAPAGAPAIIDGSAGGTVIVITGGPVTLDHVVVRNGKASQVQPLTVNGLVDGGGIWANMSQDLTVSNSTITNNYARGSGAGLYTRGAGATHIHNSVISDNNSDYFGGLSGGSAHGGGIAVENHGGPLDVDHSTISGNHGGFGGGGGIYSHPPVTVIDSTISGNVGIAVNSLGGHWGGGMTLVNGGLLLRSTVANNSAGGGGGAAVFGGVLHVIQSTFSGNQETFYETQGSAVISGSVFAPGASCSAGAAQSLGYNVFGHACGLTQPTDLPDTDPQLGALQDNGGPTFTMLPAPGSPAVNRIPVGTTLDGEAACPRTDQRGVAGPVAPQTSCTVGSVEPAPNPAASVADVSVLEGAGSDSISQTTIVSIPVMLSQSSTTAITIPYSFGGGTATPGSDYVGTSGVLTIPAGQTTGTVSATVRGDYFVESNETFTVTLGAPAGATIADGTGVVTILNDDRACSNIVERLLDHLLNALLGRPFTCQ